MVLLQLSLQEELGRFKDGKAVTLPFLQLNNHIIMVRPMVRPVDTLNGEPFYLRPWYLDCPCIFPNESFIGPLRVFNRQAIGIDDDGVTVLLDVEEIARGHDEGNT